MRQMFLKLRVRWSIINMLLPNVGFFTRVGFLIESFRKKHQPSPDHLKLPVVINGNPYPPDVTVALHYNENGKVINHEPDKLYSPRETVD